MINDDIECLCLRLCHIYHDGQTRRGGEPYSSHPIAVAHMVSKHDRKKQCVALLHDVLEDTGATPKDLLDKGIPVDIVACVQELTHDPKETYLDYIRRLNTDPSGFYASIKIADIVHNLSSDPTPKQVNKYLHALEIFAGIAS